MDREQTTLRLPAELLERLRRQAQERGYTVNDHVIPSLCHFDIIIRTNHKKVNSPY